MYMRRCISSGHIAQYRRRRAGDRLALISNYGGLRTPNNATFFSSRGALVTTIEMLACLVHSRPVAAWKENIERFVGVVRDSA